MRNVTLGLTALLGLAMVLGACGRISFATAPAASYQPGWDYNYSAYRDGGFRYASGSLLDYGASARFRELTEDLSARLDLNRLGGTPGFRHLWPQLDAGRARLLQPAYDPFRQLLSWKYENPGDLNLDGAVNTADLVPVARYPEWQPGYAWSAGNGWLPEEQADFEAWFRWADSDANGLLDSANVGEIAASYGRVVSGYLVRAGMAPDPAAMDQLGTVRFAERLPGFPPQFVLNVPGGYRYACLQPYDGKLAPLCSYVFSLYDSLPVVTVIDAPSPSLR